MHLKVLDLINVLNIPFETKILRNKCIKKSVKCGASSFWKKGWPTNLSLSKKQRKCTS